METSITSEMTSQQTICGEPGKHNKYHKFIEIAKKIPWTSHNDNELNQAQSKEHRKNLINAR